MARLHNSLVLALWLLLLPIFANSRTRSILENGVGATATVQAGIDSAAIGDTVLVNPGTYNEVIDFLSKDTTSLMDHTVTRGGRGIYILEAASTVSGCSIENARWIESASAPIT